MRYLKIILGVLALAMGALWIAAMVIQEVAGVANMPADIKTLHDAAMAALIWLAHTPPVAAYGFGLFLMAVGLGTLFWHPEKGWRFYFEQRLPEALAHSPLPDAQSSALAGAHETRLRGKADIRRP